MSERWTFNGRLGRSPSREFRDENAEVLHRGPLTEVTIEGIGHGAVTWKEGDAPVGNGKWNMIPNIHASWGPATPLTIHVWAVRTDEYHVIICDLTADIAEGVLKAAKV